MKKILIFIIYISVCSIGTLISQPSIDWVANYIHPSNFFNAISAEMDPSGNIYIIGYNVNHDNMLIKIDQNGSIVWVKYYPDAWAFVIKTDNNGNIYLGGNNHRLSFDDFWVIKYSPEGDIVWENSLSGNGNYSLDRCNDLLIDNSGNVYATGYLSIQGSFSDYCTIKYNPDGSRNWVRTIHFGTDYEDKAVSIAMDNAGGIYVTGNGTAYNYATVKYDINGNLLWQRTVWGEARKILTDNANNSIVTGTAGTISYNSGGSIIWGPVISGSPDDMAIDNNLNSIITGTIFDSVAQQTSLLLVKYNNSGNLLWSNSLQGQFEYSMGKSLAVDENDNIYVVGKEGYFNKANLLTLKYSPLGVNLWNQIYSDPSDSFYNPIKLIRRNNKIYSLANLFNKDLHKYGCVVIKFGETIGIQPINNTFPNQFSLSQNYPNPFNPTTNIRFEISGTSVAQTFLFVYDMLGREVATLVKEQLKPGTYEVNWDASNYPSGVYFYKLSTPGFTETKKMVLLK